MIKLKFKVLFIILVNVTAFGQKLGLDKVTKSELLEKQHKKDTAAAAAFIFKKATTTFNFTERDGFVPTTVFQVKVKIYKKEGLNWANFRIPYYIGYKTISDEYVDVVGGYTYNLENDKVVKTKVTGEGKFKEKINENWEVKSITFPNVKVGSIIELEYRFKSENLSILPQFQFQYDIPVDYAEFKTFVPEFYLYSAMKRGYIDLSIDQKLESTAQSFQAKVDLASVGRTLNYKQVVTDYKVSDVPALMEEDYVNNINNYYGKIEHELKTIRYPDEEPKQIATTWEAVAKSIYDDKDFNSASSKFDYFANDVKSIINGVESPEERVKKIFNFVKSRMTWNDYYGYYPKQKMEDAYRERVGNIGEINLMLVSMLRMAGIEANPVLVSTRENGFGLFPSRTLFNYLIVAAQIDETTLLMDATNKLSDINMLPIRALNWQGRLIKKDGTSAEINLMPNKNSKSVVNIQGNINGQGEVTGKIRQQYFDYCALKFREDYGGLTTESYIEQLERKNHGLEITTYDVQNTKDLNLPVVENYEFKSTNSVEIIGDKMYVSPFIFFVTDSNPFKQEKREYPIDFVFPKEYKFNIGLTIPEGYVVETLPQPKAVGIAEGMGNFKYNISNNGKQIQLIWSQEINKAVIEPEYYEALKNFYKEIINKQTERIVLKKT
jgi:hypothetical protein